MFLRSLFSNYFQIYFDNLEKMKKFHQTNNLERILEVQEDKKSLEDITEETTEEQKKKNLKLNLEDLKKKYKRDNRELYY